MSDVEIMPVNTAECVGHRDSWDYGGYIHPSPPPDASTHYITVIEDPPVSQASSMHVIT